MRLFNALSLCVIILASISGVAIAELPRISDARVVQPPPGSKVAAAYFTIRNTASEPLLITDVKSDIANRVEVHLSSVENDVAKMEKQQSVTVESGASLEFKHGSYHVMFMGLNEVLKAGNSFDVTLVTNAGDIVVSVPVISIDDAMSMQHDMKEKTQTSEESR